MSSAVPPCCTLCCSKWHHVAARTAGPGGRRGRLRSRSRPRSRASADPRATFGPGRRRSARRSCRSIRRRTRRSSADSKAGPPSSRTAGRRAANGRRRRAFRRVNLRGVREEPRLIARRSDLFITLSRAELGRERRFFLRPTYIRFFILLSVSTESSRVSGDCFGTRLRARTVALANNKREGSRGAASIHLDA